MIRKPQRNCAELDQETPAGSAVRSFSNVLALTVQRQAIAPGHGHRRVAELLLAHYADPQATGWGGVTPLMFATASSNRAVAEVLIDCKAGLNMCQSQWRLAPAADVRR